MSDVGGSGVKLISVTIVTPISFEGVVGFLGGVGRGGVPWKWGRKCGQGEAVGVGRGFF